MIVRIGKSENFMLAIVQKILFLSWMSLFLFLQVGFSTQLKYCLEKFVQDDSMVCSMAMDERPSGANSPTGTRIVLSNACCANKKIDVIQKTEVNLKDFRNSSDRIKFFTTVPIDQINSSSTNNSEFVSFHQDRSSHSPPNRDILSLTSVLRI